MLSSPKPYTLALWYLKLLLLLLLSAKLHAACLRHMNVAIEHILNKTCHADLRAALLLQALALANLPSLSSVRKVLSTLRCCLKLGG